MRRRQAWVREWVMLLLLPYELLPSAGRSEGGTFEHLMHASERTRLVAAQRLPNVHVIEEKVSGA